MTPISVDKIRPALKAVNDTDFCAGRYDIAARHWTLRLVGKGSASSRVIRSVPEFQVDRPDNDMSMTDRDIRMRHYILWLLGWSEVPPLNIHNDPQLFKSFKYDTLRTMPDHEHYSLKALSDDLAMHYNTLQDYVRGPRWGKLNGEWRVRRTDPLKAQGLTWLLLAPRNLPSRALANLRQVVRDFQNGKVKDAEVSPPQGIVTWNEAQLYGWILFGSCRQVEDAPEQATPVATYTLTPDFNTAMTSLELQVPRLVEDEEAMKRLDALFERIQLERRAYLERHDHPENRTGADCDQPNHCAAIL